MHSIKFKLDASVIRTEHYLPPKTIEECNSTDDLIMNVIAYETQIHKVSVKLLNLTESANISYVSDWLNNPKVGAITVPNKFPYRIKTVIKSKAWNFFCHFSQIVKGNFCKCSKISFYKFNVSKYRNGARNILASNL